MMRLFAAAVFASLAVPAADAQEKPATETAIFAGGCFWCVEADFDKVPGVVSTISGYTGGTTEMPTYYDYVEGGHREAVRIKFDPARVTFEKLLDVFFRSVDPTDDGGQFCDRGNSYTTAIYVLDDRQKAAAQQAKAQAENTLGQEVVTPIEPAGKFWPAEEYHQDYYKKDERVLSRFGLVTKADAYKGYREGCGRDARLRQVWGQQAMRGIEG
jgi:peptide-methionine (S)-S-oxide reductase